MWTVTIGSQLWNCAFSFRSKRRIDAFRRCADAVACIKDDTLRPTRADLTSAYYSLAGWARRSPANGRMSHEPASRRWYLEISKEA